MSLERRSLYLFSSLRVGKPLYIDMGLESDNIDSLQLDI